MCARVNEDHTTSVRSTETKVASARTKRTFKVQERAVLSTPSLPLANDHGVTHFLTELGLSLLNSGQDHIADTGGRQTIQAPFNTADRDDIQVLSAGVVCAVHNGTNRETEGHAELAAGSTSATYACEKVADPSSGSEIQRSEAALLGGRR
jgi:hypothetical protein